MDLAFRTHAGPLLRYLLRFNPGDRSGAEDLVQETLLRAWRYLRDGRLEVQTMRPWLYTVARRLVIDSVRARRARPAETATTDVTQLASPLDEAERVVRAQAVREALMELTPDHRRALIEVYYNHRTVTEVAELLGVPEGTIKTRVFYALRKMRANMARDD
jgi:RNA polymerase sigma-70 factor (ECF subfamily)